MKKALEIRNLRVKAEGSTGPEIVHGVSLDIEPGEIHALVGESGSGKSMTAHAVMGLLDRKSLRVSGELLFEGRNLLELDGRTWRSLLGSRIAMIFQEPRKYLNPSRRIGSQLAETVRLHQKLSRAETSSRVADLLLSVDLFDSPRITRAYPHELSGGMAQRVMIAQALASKPALLIADEPTTALDANRRSSIEHLIRTRAQEAGTAVLFISHDLRSVARIADRVSVMYAGKIVETVKGEDFEYEPRHPYTRMLRMAIPDTSRRGTSLQVIPGQVPEPGKLPPGCAFSPRCPYRTDKCTREDPPLRPAGDNGHAACWRLEDIWQYW